MDPDCSNRRSNRVCHTGHCLAPLASELNLQLFGSMRATGIKFSLSDRGRSGAIDSSGADSFYRTSVKIYRELGSWETIPVLLSVIGKGPLYAASHPAVITLWSPHPGILRTNFLKFLTVLDYRENGGRRTEQTMILASKCCQAQ